MATTFGISKRGNRTLIHLNYEYWRIRENAKGQTQWRCCKYESFQCKAKLLTCDDVVVGEQSPDHIHSGNISTSLARKAVGEMKKKMTETVATPSSSSGAIMADLYPHVLMGLPKRTSLNRVLRRHRTKELSSNINERALPPAPTDLNFTFPARFDSLLLFDSGQAENFQSN